jgi:hypothetical protein
MGYVTYTARRSLQAGVTSGDQVQLSMGFTAATPVHRSFGSQNVGASGAREGVLLRIETAWRLTTSFHLESSRADIEQFLHSVMNLETFTIDVRGTPAAPSNPRTVWLVSRSITETRRTSPGPAAFSAFQISFEVVEVAGATTSIPTVTTYGDFRDAGAVFADAVEYDRAATQVTVGACFFVPPGYTYTDEDTVITRSDIAQNSQKYWLIETTNSGRIVFKGSSSASDDDKPRARSDPDHFLIQGNWYTVIGTFDVNGGVLIADQIDLWINGDNTGTVRDIEGLTPPAFVDPTDWNMAPTANRIGLACRPEVSGVGRRFGLDIRSAIVCAEAIDSDQARDLHLALQGNAPSAAQNVFSSFAATGVFHFHGSSLGEAPLDLVTESAATVVPDVATGVSFQTFTADAIIDPPVGTGTDYESGLTPDFSTTSTVTTFVRGDIGGNDGTTPVYIVCDVTFDDVFFNATGDNRPGTEGLAFELGGSSGCGMSIDGTWNLVAGIDPGTIKVSDAAWPIDLTGYGGRRALLHFEAHPGNNRMRLWVQRADASGNPTEDATLVGETTDAFTEWAGAGSGQFGSAESTTAAVLGTTGDWPGTAHELRAYNQAAPSALPST